jgi:hypothetical protein
MNVIARGYWEIVFEYAKRGMTIADAMKAADERMKA